MTSYNVLCNDELTYCIIQCTVCIIIESEWRGVFFFHGPMGLLPNTSNCGCACAGNAGNVFSATAGKQKKMPTCITACAWRTCRDACRDRYLAVSFEFGGGGKRSRHSRHMRNPQFCVSGKRPITQHVLSIKWLSEFICSHLQYNIRCSLSDEIWQHGSWSSLVQVMGGCVTVTKPLHNPTIIIKKTSLNICVLYFQCDVIVLHDCTKRG